MEVSSADFPAPEANVTDDGTIMHRQRTSASQRCTIFRVLCFISFSCFLLHIVICYLLAAGSAPLNERDPSVQLPIVSRYPHKDGGRRNAAGDPGPWTGTAAGADQTDPYSLIEKIPVPLSSILPFA